MIKEKINITLENQDMCFEGCEGCGAKCCASNLIFLTLYDFEQVSKNFPIFFRLKNKKLSIILFFYNKISSDNKEKKCIYLKNDLCSIYEYRPYACKSFPFSFEAENTNFSYSNECHAIRKIEKIETRDIVKFIKNNKVNEDIVSDFVTPNYINHSKVVYKDTDNFLQFCMKNNMLINFRTVYKDKKYNNFQTDLQDDLYVVNKLKLAFIKMKKPQLFQNNDYLNYLHAQVYSIGHIDKMLIL
jgi:Fe-S-cluster containining protein